MPMLSLAHAPDRALRPSRRGVIAAADLAACRTMLVDGSRTFLAASYLLPKSVREPACALYAFCRVADDAIDSPAAGSGADDALAALRARLDAIYRHEVQGGSVAAPDRAFAAVVRHFGIPRELPEALLEGFAWDAAGRRYATLEQLHDYAARVAGAVGAMMSLVMGARSPEALARACDLGVAMQLSNICRDVGEDARAGRLYLPLEWLCEAGIEPEAWLRTPTFDARIAGMIARLLAHADELYARVDSGIAELPRSCRVGINAARFLYAAIGHEVARRGGNSVDSRAVVSPAKKLALLARAGTRRSRRAAFAPPPLAATRHLVLASASPVERRAEPSPSRANRVTWLIGLFERLERRDQMHHLARPS